MLVFPLLFQVFGHKFRSLRSTLNRFHRASFDIFPLPAAEVWYGTLLVIFTSQCWFLQLSLIHKSFDIGELIPLIIKNLIFTKALEHLIKLILRHWLGPCPSFVLSVLLHDRVVAVLLDTFKLFLLHSKQVIREYCIPQVQPLVANFFVIYLLGNFL